MVGNFDGMAGSEPETAGLRAALRIRRLGRDRRERNRSCRARGAHRHRQPAARPHPVRSRTGGGGIGVDTKTESDGRPPRGSRSGIPSPRRDSAAPDLRSRAHAGAPRCDRAQHRCHSLDPRECACAQCSASIRANSDAERGASRKCAGAASRRNAPGPIHPLAAGIFATGNPTGNGERPAGPGPPPCPCQPASRYGPIAAGRHPCSRADQSGRHSQPRRRVRRRPAPSSGSMSAATARSMPCVRYGSRCAAAGTPPCSRACARSSPSEKAASPELWICGW